VTSAIRDFIRAETDDGRLKTADFDTQAGFGLRGVSGETTAFAHANELSEAAIRRAAETMAVLDPASAARPAAPRGPTPLSIPIPIR
jgi:TldD protein